MNKLSLLAVAALAFATAPVMAATATSNFNVTLTVKSACSVSATDMAFGSHDFTEAGPLNANSTITVKCTKGTANNIALNKGTNGASETARVMKGATTTDTVAYKISSDTNGGNNWGTTTGSVTGTAGTGSAQTYTAYGQVLTSALNVTPDSYSDVVAVTVTY